MKSMFLTINKGDKKDFVESGIRYKVIYCGDMMLSLRLYDIIDIYYVINESDKYVEIESTTGFIRVPIDAIEKMHIR